MNTCVLDTNTHRYWERADRVFSRTHSTHSYTQTHTGHICGHDTDTPTHTRGHTHQFTHGHRHILTHGRTYGHRQRHTQKRICSTARPGHRRDCRPAIFSHIPFATSSIFPSGMRRRFPLEGLDDCRCRVWPTLEETFPFEGSEVRWCFRCRGERTSPVK